MNLKVNCDAVPRIRVFQPNSWRPLLPCWFLCVLSVLLKSGAYKAGIFYKLEDDMSKEIK